MRSETDRVTPIGPSPWLTEERCPTEKELGRPSIVVELLIDQSASVRALIPLENALQDAADFIAALPPDVIVSVRWITASSYPDWSLGPDESEVRRNLVYVGRIPPLLPSAEEPTNPYDRAAWREHRVRQLAHSISLACLEQAREAIVSAIYGLASVAPPVPSQRTDLNGALARSIERFNAFEGAQTRNVLVILSDCSDDAGRPRPTEFFPSGTQVVIRSAWPGLGQVEAKKVKDDVRTLLFDLGADVIRFEEPRHPALDTIHHLGFNQSVDYPNHTGGQSS